MLPSVELVLGTAKAVAEAVSEGFKWGQTEAGQKFTNTMLDDKAKRDAWLQKAGDKIADFFTGKLFEAGATEKPAELDATDHK